MLKISYKAVYTLLGRSYKRTSVNKLLLSDEIPDNVYQTSLIFALKAEDYEYLNVLDKNKDRLDEQYVLFIDGLDETTLTLEKDKPLSLLELAVLSLKCPKIPIAEFITTIEAQADGRYLEEAEVQYMVSTFNMYRTTIEGIILEQLKEG